MNVDFHTDVDEPLAFACRLLRKAYRQGARVAAFAPEQQLAALDAALWRFDERDFVPHLRMPGAAQEAALRTPIWLISDLGFRSSAAPLGMPDVLVNVGANLVDILGGAQDQAHFTRVIEVVSRDAETLANARQRWRQYGQWGWVVTHHKAAAAA